MPAYLRALLAIALIGAAGATLTSSPTTRPATTRLHAVSWNPQANYAAPTTSTSSPPATAPTARQGVVRASRSRASRPPLARAGVVTDDIRRRVIAAIYAYDDWDAARMVRVAICESGLSPWAVNGSHHGIFQIVGATLGLIEEHVALAHQMWQRSGMRPWQCKG
jgi:hypothetical protein